MSPLLGIRKGKEKLFAPTKSLPQFTTPSKVVEAVRATQCEVEWTRREPRSPFKLIRLDRFKCIPPTVLPRLQDTWNIVDGRDSCRLCYKCLEPQAEDGLTLCKVHAGRLAKLIQDGKFESVCTHTTPPEHEFHPPHKDTLPRFVAMEKVQGYIQSLQNLIPKHTIAFDAEGYPGS